MLSQANEHIEKYIIHTSFKEVIQKNQNPVETLHQKRLIS